MSRPPWSDTEREKAKQCRLDGISAEDARQFLPGRSRNSILGIWHRLGLTHKSAHGGHRPKPRRSLSDWTIDNREHRDTRAIADHDLFTPVALRKQLAELEAEHCRWPNGDPLKAGFHFCSQPRVLGKPYCAPHCDRAVGRMRKVARARQVTGVAVQPAESQPTSRTLAIA